MKIFVAGATGVLGSRSVQLLTRAGHDVSAIARSPEKAAFLEQLRATPVHVDVFDATALQRAVGGHDVVMNLATHIPAVAKISMLRAWRENDRIRREGSRNLVDAALNAGAVRYVQESIGFFYDTHGDAWADEDTPTALPIHGRSTTEAERQAARVETGVVLRFGMFYGGDSSQSRLQVKLARFGLSPFFGATSGYQSVIHIDDAASAVVAALDSPAGVYNVTDNEPLTKGEAADVLARCVGRKRLLALPRPLVSASGRVLRALLASQRVSNARFRSATGWKPRYPSGREGIPALVEAVMPSADRATGSAPAPGR